MGQPTGTLGDNDAGQLGDGTFGWPGRLSPVQIPSLTNIQALGAGLFNGYARQADNLLWIWGYGAGGQLGFNTYTYNPGYVPAVHTALGPLAGIAGGDTHTVALKAAGEVSAWGMNQYGQLGDGGTSVRPTPATVAGAAGDPQRRLIPAHAGDVRAARDLSRRILVVSAADAARLRARRLYPWLMPLGAR